MRLGQMARKLGVTQGEIVRYLTGKNIRIEEGSNVKLGESHMRLLYAHFAPGESFEVLPLPGAITSISPAANAPLSEGLAATEEAQTSGELILPATQRPEPPSSSAGESDEVVVPNLPPAPLSEDVASVLQSETIRASKIELAGLKVIGKIELPQPKKKEVSQPQPDSIPEHPVGDTGPSDGEPPPTVQVNHPVEEAKEGDRPRRRNEARRQGDERGARRNQGRDQRSRVNPIAEQREREQQEELERRKEKASQDKERRTQNYNKRVKHSPPTKAVRLVDEAVEELDAASFENEPKTWFSKIIKWLGF